jgi:hypothetical protein
MNSKTLLLYLFVAGLLLSGSLSSKNDFLLKTPNAKLGIISLELCPSNTKQAIILKEWKDNWAYIPKYTQDSVYSREKVYALRTVATSTKVDFAFIFFYSGLLTLLILIGARHYQGKLKYQIAIAIVMAAGISDMTENVFELLSMKAINSGQAQSGLAMFVFIPAIIKWLLIFFSVVHYYNRVLRPGMRNYLKLINTWLKDIVINLWHFRIVVIGLLVLFFLLNFVDQGYDLLVAINSSPWGVFWFLLATLVLAVLNWYLPKTYDDALGKRRSYDFKSIYSNTHNFANTETLKIYLTRLIGSATLMVPATGILKTMQSYHITYLFDGLSPLLIFLLLLFFYIEVLRFQLLDKIFLKAGKFNESRYWFLFTIVILGVGFSFYGGNKVPSSLAYVAIDLYALSFLFLVTVNYRAYFHNDLPFVPALASISAIVFTLFILFNFRWFSAWATADDRFYSLPFMIAGVVFYTVLASVLLLTGLKYNIQPITIFFLFSFMISAHTISDFHQVSLDDAIIQPNIKEDDLHTYVRQWLDSRRNEIISQNEKGKDFPVFFVNAYGGGIKAAAWTTMVIGRLDSLFILHKDSSSALPDFQHYVFSYSGASGGTIGLSLLTAARLRHADHPEFDHVFTRDSTQLKFYRHDYLTNDLIGILGRDFLMGSTGLNLYDDRAKVSEKAWEVYARRLDMAYDTILRTAWKGSQKDVPLFVSNTFDIDNGVKGILAPVRLISEDFPGALLIQNLIKPNKDIHLSTAAFLSARFPYVSPTGKFDEKHHFTDGGTVENSGAETSLQLINVFNILLDSVKKQNSAYNSVRICVLSIPNSIPAMDSVERVKNLYETSAPLLGILNTISGNSIKADLTNQELAKQKGWKYYKMTPTDLKIDNGRIHPILPLGWQISDYALDLMLASVKRKGSSLDEIQLFFEKNFSEQTALKPRLP